MSQVDKKIKFIRAWYTHECSKLEFGDRLKLARIWIEICLKDEEYEMAAALSEERQKMINKHVRNKRKSRRLAQKIVIAIYITKRKFKAFIKNKLSK